MDVVGAVVVVRMDVNVKGQEVNNFLKLTVMETMNVLARVDAVKVALAVQGKHQHKYRPSMKTMMRLCTLSVKILLLVHVNAVTVVVEKAHVFVSLVKNLLNLDVTVMVIANVEVPQLTIHALAANSVLSILKYEMLICIYY